jgi:hypothetical protein
MRVGGGAGRREVMKRVIERFSEASGWLVETASRLSVRRDSAPVDGVERLFDFVATRSALITQKKLYGYLKERIGIRYPEMFEDEVFARSIDIARMQVFAASLADLTVHAVAQVAAGGRLPADGRGELAIACYDHGVAVNEGQAPDPGSPEAWRAAFAERLSRTAWENIAAGASAFTESPKALIRWAPIADEHKRFDREVVENSIRFAWNEVIQDLRNRLDAAGVAASWGAGGNIG